MSKKIKHGWIILMILCIFLPYPLYFVFLPILDTQNYEKRELAKFPVINTFDDLVDAPSQIDDYINDHMAFRNQLIRTVNYSNYKLFGVSPSKKVIVGKNGWLYYNSVANNDKVGKYEANTIADYQGTNLYTEAELESISQNVSKNSKALKELGIEFVILIAPNKEHVYDDFMPSRYGKLAEKTRADQLVQYLRDNTDVKIVYPYEQLLKYKDEHDLYYHLDTHWNNLGAYIGTKELMKELGTSMPNIEELRINKINESGLDLSDMMNTRTLLKDDVNYDLEHDGIEKNPCRMLFLHDSFGIAMEEHIDSAVVEYKSFNSWEYNEEMLMVDMPTVVVFETVERYLDRLRIFSLP